MILTLKTSEPQAEIGLFDATGERLAYESWEAHRELSSTILAKLTAMLADQEKTLGDIDSAVFYEGPGSFTGLRIGAAMVNALEVPVANATGATWIADGLMALRNGSTGTAIPMYGREPHITQPKK